MVTLMIGYFWARRAGRVTKGNRLSKRAVTSYPLAQRRVTYHEKSTSDTMQMRLGHAIRTGGFPAHLAAYFRRFATGAKAMQKFQGNLPQENSEWKEIGSVEAHGDKWLVFAKPPNKHSWRPVKVVASSRRHRKPNFWLNYSAEENRLACGKDYKIMEEHYPHLFQRLHENML